MYWLKGLKRIATLCDIAVSAALHFRRLLIEKRRDKIVMMFSSTDRYQILQVKTLEFLSLSGGLLFHC